MQIQFESNGKGNRNDNSNTFIIINIHRICCDLNLTPADMLCAKTQHSVNTVNRVNRVPIRGNWIRAVSSIHLILLYHLSDRAISFREVTIFYSIIFLLFFCTAMVCFTSSFFVSMICQSMNVCVYVYMFEVWMDTGWFVHDDQRYEIVF